LIDDIGAKLSEQPRKEDAAYALIVGAGFSYGVVPMTKELLHELIGSYYYLSDGNTELSCEEARDKSRDYWQEFNNVCEKSGEPSIELDKGLPANDSLAYQELFTYRIANAHFGSPSYQPSRFLARWNKARPAVKSMSAPKMLSGEQFVRDFLRHVLDPGAYLSGAPGDNAGSSTIGRSQLNDAHRFLASLIELQETGKAWQLRPFCRTIFTTNFDTLLQNALQSVEVSFRLSNRPEDGLELPDSSEQDRVMHLVYTHGSVLRHNAASSTKEISDLSVKNAKTLRQYLQSKDVLVFGYGGWNDSLMSALNECDKTSHRIYWCNVFPAEEAQTSLAPEARDLILSYEGRAFYVPLGDAGADGFMRQLYRALAPTA
jgi:hypothetical protein